MEKWIQYYHNELLFFEFADIVVQYLVKKNKDLLHPKEEEQRGRIMKALTKLRDIETKEPARGGQNRVWPVSTKDTQKSQLKELRIQQEARAKQRKLNEEERKRE